jgi:hypothetical protein
MDTLPCNHKMNIKGHIMLQSKRIPLEFVCRAHTASAFCMFCLLHETRLTETAAVPSPLPPPRYRCLGPGYLWIRFGQGTTNSFIATNTGLKRPVYVQSTWLRSRDALGWPIRYQYVLDLIEELTLCK